ncbi:hypothetical protein [Luteimonas lutimaris]|uniref:DUF885 domain-containing protein n=1 Tax=Luteimonas lutimaris TaxID=698645 RepID=A0ABP7N425_9GAMM|nr:hypothetical protein [Luteimonas sp.]
MPRLPVLACLIACGLASAAAPAPATVRESTPAAKQAMGASISAQLQGDSRAALRALDAVPADQFGDFAAQYRACMHGRFDRENPPWIDSGIDDPFVRDVLWTYQAYWWRALADPAHRDAQAEALLQRLRALLGPEADGAQDFEALEPVLSAKLLEHGYHALQGLTPPLRELMLWRSEDVREYDVALPEGPQHVTVHLLDDFAAWGWSHYARCGLGSNGGWTTDDAVYAVRPGYPDLDGEKFQVSLLGHEGQHFADKQRWQLEAWELEYRAKLTELALADRTSHDLLEKFGQSHGADSSMPHPYADEQALAAIRRQLGGGDALDLTSVPLHDLQQAAREALLADTRARMASAKPAGG